MAASNDLRFEPDGVRGELPVLFHGAIGSQTQFDGRRNRGQIAGVLRDQGVQPPMQRVNIVFMGMGEPFLNYETSSSQCSCWWRAWGFLNRG